MLQAARSHSTRNWSNSTGKFTASTAHGASPACVRCERPVRPLPYVREGVERWSSRHGWYADCDACGEVVGEIGGGEEGAPLVGGEGEFMRAEELDAEVGEGGGIIIADAMDADHAVLGLHLNADLMQQVFILAQEFGHAGQCEHVRNRCHDQAA